MNTNKQNKQVWCLVEACTFMSLPICHCLNLTDVVYNTRLNYKKKKKKSVCKIYSCDNALFSQYMKKRDTPQKKICILANIYTRALITKQVVMKVLFPPCLIEHILLSPIKQSYPFHVCDCKRTCQHTCH